MRAYLTHKPVQHHSVPWSFYKMNVYPVHSSDQVDFQPHKYHDLAGGGRESPTPSRRYHCSSSTSRSRDPVHATARCDASAKGCPCSQRSEDHGESGRGACCFNCVGDLDEHRSHQRFPQKSRFGTEAGTSRLVVSTCVVHIDERCYAGQLRYRASPRACPCSSEGAGRLLCRASENSGASARVTNQCKGTYWNERPGPQCWVRQLVGPNRGRRCTHSQDSVEGWLCFLCTDHTTAGISGSFELQFTVFALIER